MNKSRKFLVSVATNFKLNGIDLMYYFKLQSCHAQIKPYFPKQRRSFRATLLDPRRVTLRSAFDLAHPERTKGGEKGNVRRANERERVKKLRKQPKPRGRRMGVPGVARRIRRNLLVPAGPRQNRLSVHYFKGRRSGREGGEDGRIGERWGPLQKRLGRLV